MYVINRTRGTYLGVDVEVAKSLLARMRGLYGRQRLHFGDGVWIVPCRSIQTIGMKAAIDVIFLNRAGRCVRVFENVRPGRMIWPVPRAQSALELPAGVVRSSQTQVGDLVGFIQDLKQPIQEAAGAGLSARD